MTKHIPGVIAVLLLAGHLSAGDPWKDKPYTQWDEKDVRKILSGSPWAKEVRVAAVWQGGVGRTPAGVPNPSGGGYGERPSGGAPAGDAPTSGRIGEEVQQGAGAQASFIIRWGSARTLRQALARAAVLRGTPQADAERFLAQEPQEYVIVVLGQDMTPFVRVQEGALKEKSYLLGKKTKAKLAPRRVEIQRVRDSQDITAVVFYFARKTAADEPTIAAEERSVEFACEAGGMYLQTSFDLQKMAGPQGLDL